MVLLYVAGTCLSFSHEDRNLFVVGAENGSLFKCSMQGTTAGGVDETTSEWWEREKEREREREGKEGN